MNARSSIPYLSLLFLFLGFFRVSLAQGITVGKKSYSEDITVRTLGKGYSSLNFNKRFNKITINSGIIYIQKEDDDTAVFEISAPSELQLEISLEYTPYLMREGGSTKDQAIPLVLSMAYHNQNAPNEIVAKRESIDLPAGITSFTIPVNERYQASSQSSFVSNGSGFDRPTSVVYVFVFGALGPLRAVSAGNYGCQLSINVHGIRSAN